MYGLVLGLLAVVSVIDVRSRRVPNVLAGGTGLFCGWLGVWCSGLLGAHMGLGFRAEFLGPAPDVLVPPGSGNRRHLLCEWPSGRRGARRRLARADHACTSLFRRKEAFGGGDIKLMAVLGLFLGLERGVVCLLTACLLSVAYVLGREIRSASDGTKRRRDRKARALSTSADLAGTGAAFPQ